MDVNEYMKRSIALQERTVELLEQLVSMRGSEVTLDVRMPAEDAAAVEQAAAAARAAKASTKQAANHDRDDAKQEETKQEAAAATGAKPPTADDVRAALMALGKREGTEAAIALLKKYKATSVSSLDESQFAEVIADAKGGES